MVISLLCEPRSGSTNLANWFYLQKNIDVLFEPLNPISEWYQNDINPSLYKRIKDILCIKEIYYPHKEWNDIINISDKVVVLYRENTKEQLESFLNSVMTDNWLKKYIYKPIDNNFIREKTDYFNQLKFEFKERYISNENYFKISYEDLYERNKFQNLLDYLSIDGLTIDGFPYGEKYRIFPTKPLSLI
jgi:hypothetical protein